MTGKDTEVEEVRSDKGTPVGKLAKSLPELVAKELLDAIRQGELKPGERLKEEVFAERFAVSRSTIREAIALLERRGIVERLPRYGARVVIIDQEELKEIFAIRAQLLGLAARMTAEAALDTTISHFERHVDHLQKLANDPGTEPARYAQASIEAQRLLVSAWKGKRLRAIYEELSEAALWRFAVREPSTSFQTQSRRQESARDWLQVASALKQRDGAKAEQHAKELLEASYQAVQQQLRAQTD